MATYIAPLDLRYIFQNVLAGSPEVFMGLFYLVLTILSGLLRIPSQAYLVLIGLSSIILYGWFGDGLYLLSVSLAGLLVFWAIKRIVST